MALLSPHDLFETLRAIRHKRGRKSSTRSSFRNHEYWMILEYFLDTTINLMAVYLRYQTAYDYVIKRMKEPPDPVARNQYWHDSEQDVRDVSCGDTSINTSLRGSLILKPSQQSNNNNETNVDTAGGTDDTSGGTKPSTGKLQLKASLKKVLMTKKGLSGDEVEQIWAESVQK